MTPRKCLLDTHKKGIFSSVDMQYKKFFDNIPIFYPQSISFRVVHWIDDLHKMHWCINMILCTNYYALLFSKILSDPISKSMRFTSRQDNSNHVWQAKNVFVTTKLLKIATPRYELRPILYFTYTDFNATMRLENIVFW